MLSVLRRFTAICLLMLLPLQFSWAAVAAYCAHEADPQVQHLGHHVHADANADAAAPAGDGGHPGAQSGAQPGGQSGDDASSHSSKQPANGAVDLDGCHSQGCCLGIVCSGPVIHLGLPATARPALLVAPVATLAHAPPDRPQWAGLA